MEKPAVSKTLETVTNSSIKLYIACYFNSLLQVYYTIPDLVNEILEFKEEGDIVYEEFKKHYEVKKDHDLKE